jgi:hypothetical protein
VNFLWAKGLNAKYIHKQMFPLYDVCRAYFTSGWQTSADDKEVETEVAETTVERFLGCGF